MKPPDWNSTQGSTTRRGEAIADLLDGELPIGRQRPRTSEKADFIAI